MTNREMGKSIYDSWMSTETNDCLEVFAYNKGVEDLKNNLLRNSRTEVIDGKIQLIVTEDRIKAMADIMTEVDE